MQRHFVAAATAMAAFASVALGDGRINVTDATGRYNSTDSSGGPFVAQRLAGYVGARFGELGLTGERFYTFCVEKDEYLNFSGNFYAEISTSAMLGGVGGPTPDPLSNISARLYMAFRNNESFGTSGKVTDGSEGAGQAFVRAIQDAIWYEEEEIASISGLAQNLWTWARDNQGTSIGNVRVLRLWQNYSPLTGEYSGPKQDVLTVIPLPSAAGLAGLGLLGLGARVRRRAF